MIEVGLIYLVVAVGVAIYCYATVRARDSYMTTWEVATLAAFIGTMWPVLLVFAIVFFIRNRIWRE